MNISNNEVVVLHLTSGISIIGVITDQSKKALDIDHAFEMNMIYNKQNIPRLYLQPFLYYSEDGIQTIQKKQVISYQLCSDSIAEMYIKKVLQFKALMNADLDELEKMVDKMSDPTDRSQTTSENLPTNKPKTTIH